jgi:beta-N-acetylhexosaminidase
MGQAFISGIHQGSNNKMVVAAKHFPGFGGSDRLPEEEVATVRSSLEQLKQIDLAPFFAVTGNAPNPESVTDA